MTISSQHPKPGKAPGRGRGPGQEFGRGASERARVKNRPSAAAAFVRWPTKCSPVAVGIEIVTPWRALPRATSPLFKTAVRFKIVTPFYHRRALPPGRVPRLVERIATLENRWRSYSLCLNARQKLHSLRPDRYLARGATQP